MKPAHGTIRFFRLLPVLVISALLATGCYNPSEGTAIPLRSVPT